MSAFNGATLMITGGTGSFGNAVLKHFLETDIGQIRIFSRDEKKQDDRRHALRRICPVIVKHKISFFSKDTDFLPKNQGKDKKTAAQLPSTPFSPPDPISKK